MKNKLVILSLFVAAAVTATAQTKEKFFSEKAGDNIFISIGGGVQASMNPDNRDNGLGDAITPKVSFSIGKWFTPVWGIRGQVNGWKTTLYTDYNAGTVDADGNFSGYGDFEKVKKNYINTHLDGLLNLSNLFCGYNPNRVFTFSVFAGPGFTFAKGYGTQEYVVNTANGTWVRNVDSGKVKALINGSVGIMGQFNIGKYWDINIEARGEVSPSPFGKYTRSHTDGAVSVMAGLSYTFGGKKFVNCGPKIDVDALNNEINKYRQALKDAEDELAACKRSLANKPQTKEVVKEIEVAGPRAIFFQIGKSKIDDYGMVNIQLAAKIIKANPNKKYKIAGYADKATGSSSWNQTLSERRAQEVYDALIKEGVSSSQLELVGFGGTDNMFGKNMLNRVVILE
ncbi:OmpA family protein [Bacteroides sp. 214]|uniref:OmpA family protein n=1 Tax=Bacteroides sp. 214 TaxID=2302935 RepID=UPI0013D04A80|nr:OmpA family protein [Bacteroides sp. 214]NDW11543.1 OmpA family protein [Bacteroides sp. 214]